MHHRPFPARRFDAVLRVPVAAALALAAGVAVAACGGSNPPSAASTHTGSSTSGSCGGVAGAHHARVVVEVSSHKIVQRCVGFTGSKIAALTLLHKSRVETGTQKYSFGVAICQVDNVPSHYTQCLPSGQDYWALFLSTDGHSWTSPSTGVSDISVPPGGSIGLRYDSPKGSPAPPPKPTPA
jgi:hypothetical protein